MLKLNSKKATLLILKVAALRRRGAVVGLRWGSILSRLTKDCRPARPRFQLNQLMMKVKPLSELCLAGAHQYLLQGRRGAARGRHIRLAPPPTPTTAPRRMEY